MELKSKDGWKIVEDEWFGSYAVKGKTWIGYNGLKLVHNKASYVRERGLLGVILYNSFAWDGPLEGYGKYPTLAVAYTVLKHPRPAHTKPDPIKPANVSRDLKVI